MDLVGSVAWENYKSLINQAHDTFSQDTIVWKRSLGGIDYNGEDNLTERFSSIDLKCLINYNVFRVWPTNQPTTTGELDRETMALLLNIRYLDSLGYLNANGNFVYNQDKDRFIHHGITYKSGGDTKVAQANDEPLIIQLMLIRQETNTSDEPK